MHNVYTKYTKSEIISFDVLFGSKELSTLANGSSSYYATQDGEIRQVKIQLAKMKYAGIETLMSIQLVEQHVENSQTNFSIFFNT